jgi:hypothetical protein
VKITRSAMVIGPTPACKYHHCGVAGVGRLSGVVAWQLELQLSTTYLKAASSLNIPHRSGPSDQIVVLSAIID